MEAMQEGSEMLETMTKDDLKVYVETIVAQLIDERLGRILRANFRAIAAAVITVIVAGVTILQAYHNLEAKTDGAVATANGTAKALQSHLETIDKERATYRDDMQRMSLNLERVCTKLGIEPIRKNQE